MNKFLRTILICAVLFFIFDKVGYLILDKTRTLQADHKLEQILNGNLDKELLVLGSSRGIVNIDAQQLEEQTKKSSYNLSYSGSDIVFQDFILRTYLAHNDTPSQLLLIIDNPYLFMIDTNLEYRFDRLYPLANNSYINNELIDLEKHSIASKFLYLLRVHGDQLKFNEVKTSNDWPIDDYGSQMIYGRAKSFTETKPVSSMGYKNLEESETKIAAFYRILKRCKENSIKVHLVFSPDFSLFNNEFYERFIPLIPYDVAIYVYDQSNTEYLDSKNFYDLSHLNRKGVEIFTKELSQYFNELK